VIFDGSGAIVHRSGQAAELLGLSDGGTADSFLRRLEPALGVELRTALSRASSSKLSSEMNVAAMEIGGVVQPVTIRVLPVEAAAPDFILVTFEVRTPAAQQAAAARLSAGSPDPVATERDREIEHRRPGCSPAVEQHEAGHEELKAGDEELQSLNQALRATTEELETGREELQSLHEEISSVNVELKSSVAELGTSNSDMQNLVDATAIPTVFLDRELRITRYTPAAVEIFKLIPGDLGRPLTDLRTELDYPALADDARGVLEHLVPVEREVSRGQTWFAARLLPYRSGEDRVCGVVLTLVDITDHRSTVTALQASEERLRLILENAREYAIFSMDLERRVTSWHSGAERLLGYSEAEMLGRSGDLIFTPEDLAMGRPIDEAETALEAGRAADERFHQREDGSRFWASGVMMPMHGASGGVVGFVKILRDQTEARLTQEALERSRADLLQAWQQNEIARRDAELQKEHLSALFSQAPAPICILRGSDYRIEFANPAMCQLWGRSLAEVIDRAVFEAIPGARHTVFKDMLDGVLQSGVPYVGKEVPALLDRQSTGTPEEAYLNFTYAPLRDLEGRIDGVLAMAFDVTDEIRAREKMSELHEMAQAASRAKDDFLAMLGHELRNPLAPLQTSLHLIRQRVLGNAADALLDIAERQAGNLSRIVEDLLEAARITEGKIDLRRERIDMVAAVQPGHRVGVRVPRIAAPRGQPGAAEAPGLDRRRPGSDRADHLQPAQQRRQVHARRRPHRGRAPRRRRSR
jgi:PAS domain S-box-containing protein